MERNEIGMKWDRNEARLGVETETEIGRGTVTGTVRERQRCGQGMEQEMFNAKASVKFHLIT